MKDIIAEFLWLLSRWWFWLTWIAGILVYWYLFRRRVYKTIDKQLFVRHGQLGKWLDLEEHLKTEHPEEYEIYKQRTRRG